LRDRPTAEDFLLLKRKREWGTKMLDWLQLGFNEYSLTQMSGHFKMGDAFAKVTVFGARIAPRLATRGQCQGVAQTTPFPMGDGCGSTGIDPADIIGATGAEEGITANLSFKQKWGQAKISHAFRAGRYFFA
jgi:hypothetical protein